MEPKNVALPAPSLDPHLSKMPLNFLEITTKLPYAHLCRMPAGPAAEGAGEDDRWSSVFDSRFLTSL
jgi:hypothetical protein